MQRRGWIGVDLDGTFATVDHSIPYCHGICNGKTHIIGPPAIPPGGGISMLDRVKMWLAGGMDVRIFTARVGEPIEPAAKAAVIADIQAYMLEHVGQALPVTACKDIDTIEIWDDRAVKVKFNQGEPL